MVSSATELAEYLEDNWSLTGELDKTYDAGTGQTENVRFFDSAQIKGNDFSKVVTVEKINAEGQEEIINHPKFSEVSDLYEITLHFRLTDTDRVVISEDLDFIEQMGIEVISILKTKYDPQTTTGTYFRYNQSWQNEDVYDGEQAELIRRLSFRLTKIVSSSDEVFTGFGGVLVFDTSSSSADSLPASDYTYTQIERVQITQGWRQIPYYTTDSPDSVALPTYFRGAFSGRFTGAMDLKKSDFDSGTFESLSEIFLPQSNGELGTAVFLYSITNTESTASTLTESVPVNIVQVEKIGENEELVKFIIRGNLTQSTTISFT